MSLLDRLHYTFSQHLNSEIVATLLCGSTINGLMTSSDIDCVIVVKKITPETSKSLSIARKEIEKLTNTECSTTVISLNDVINLTYTYSKIDGKAVQCLIEAGSECTKSNDVDFVIPTLSNEQIRKYSYANYWVIRSLLIKQLIRSEPTLSKSDFRKLAKIGLIATKMADQYTGKNSQILHKKLQDIKSAKYTDSRQNIFKVLIQCSELITD